MKQNFISSPDISSGILSGFKFFFSGIVTERRFLQEVSELFQRFLTWFLKVSLLNVFFVNFSRNSSWVSLRNFTRSFSRNYSKGIPPEITTGLSSEISSRIGLEISTYIFLRILFLKEFFQELLGISSRVSQEITEKFVRKLTLGFLGTY